MNSSGLTSGEAFYPPYSGGTSGYVQTISSNLPAPKMHNYCPECGRARGEGWKVCPFDGTSLTPAYYSILSAAGFNTTLANQAFAALTNAPVDPQ